MPLYRATVRYAASGRHRYHLEDVDAPTLMDAVRLAAERVPDEVGSTADLVEVRVQVDPERRDFVPG
jgi:hypothetical protein